MVNNAFIARKKCPFCESKNIIEIYKKKYSSNDIIDFLKDHLNNFPLKILKNEKFIIMECEICKGIFQKNILNDFYNNKFYENYVPHDIAFNKKKEKIDYFKKVQSYEVLFIKNHFQKNNKIKVLEFGAGWGLWSINAQKNNLNVTAIEISKTRLKYLKKNKIKVLDSINKITGKYDFIFSDQTFEHLNNPFIILKKLSMHLNKNGIIFLKVPPGTKIKKKLKKNYTVGDDEIIPMEHINVFNRKVNTKLAQNLGLKYIYPKNCYPTFSLNFFKKTLTDLYDYYSSKTIIFKK